MTPPDRPPLDRLRELVAALRHPATGCPWDLDQTHASLARYAIEEAHEVAEAAERGVPSDLADELGDLLLQVLLHARLAEEVGAFDLDDVARGLAAKLLRRHPHVFGSGQAPPRGRRPTRSARRGRRSRTASARPRRRWWPPPPRSTACRWPSPRSPAR